MTVKDTVDLSSYLGKELSPEKINELLVEGRIRFPQKDVGSPSAVSRGADKDSCSPSSNIDPKVKKDQQLKDLINNVKDNENLIKTLEDMRDDLLAGMSITPTSDRVGKAAAIINGDGNKNITADTFKDAEAIVEIGAYDKQGYIPQLVPLIGDARIESNLGSCDSITKAAFDGFKFAKEGATPEEILADNDDTIAQNIEDTQGAFADKMDALSLYLINKLFWNIIWTRIWVSVFDMVEKLIAVPIDTGILILRGLLFKIPPLTKSNYYRFGPIHKALNKFKMIILCKVPNIAWKDYKPEDTVQIFWRGEMVPLFQLCSNELIDTFDNCVNKDYPEKYKDNDYQDGANDDNSIEGSKMAPDDMESDGNKIKQSMDEGDKLGPNMIDPCDLLNRLGKSFENMPDEDIGVTPDCLQAAHIVLKAAYNDAKYNNKG